MISKAGAPNGAGTANSVALNLPDSKSPTLTLDHPTDEEKLAIWQKNCVMWKGALSHEAYLRRENYLASQEFTKNGGITYWVLVDTAAEERVILSSCETIRKKALVFQNRKMEDVVTHGIGSVFCAPECRKRGYAQRMMRELGQELKTWQAPAGQQCAFSILYSDIGKVRSISLSPLYLPR
jgi:GNAT superfamily N-acetyltransferase